MLDLELVAVQIEEAGRLAKIRRLPHLRLAFLLLDNVVEVMLHREVESETFFQDVNVAMRLQMQRMQPFHGDKPEFMALLTDIESRIPPERKMEDLEERFRAKVNFLAERKRLDPPVAAIVKKLHRYRNDLYHRLQLRREVLEPATLIYFDVACAVLATWRFQRSWSSAESYEDLARFGVTAHALFQEDITTRIASQLRESVGMNVSAIRTALINHLDGRLDDLEETVSMVRAAMPDEYDDPDDVYRIVQSDWKNELPAPNELRERRFVVLGHKLPLSRRQVASLTDIPERYVMYARYAAIEDDFESFEAEASALHEAIERLVQQAVDEERGK
ncbi:MAG: hypothetical protein M0Z40_15070 [Actinomycetota bacterium]|nr:hypothetical protein [Actinomycetota bacterium]MDA8076522.1 hypothetical protein [Actinomycetota bacterium]